MDNYIKLKEYAAHLEIEKGDTILVSSDAKVLLWDAKKNNESTDLNAFIDGLIEAVGEEGTVIFPTYNWDFCGGTTFDYRSTPCRTGALGILALKKEGFKRTKHPIYSFAVWGRYQEELCNMTNTDSFGTDSPFAFFHKHNVKNYIVDVSLQDSLTFTHYVEQQSGLVKHRFIKDFTAGYVDENGCMEERTYSMFVRYLDMDVNTLINPIEEDLLEAQAEKKYFINHSEIKRVYLGQAYDVLLKDIRENRSRKLCTFIGQ